MLLKNNRKMLNGRKAQADMGDLIRKILIFASALILIGIVVYILTAILK